MSKYPNQLDDDVSLPRVDNNVTEEGDVAINALRDVAFALEAEVGIGASGTRDSLSDRLGVSLDGYGNIKASALIGLGLITLPITNAEISATAAIAESKLALDYPTSTLYNIINNLNTSINTSLNFITNHGSKIEPHLVGFNYRHVLNQIDIDLSTSNYFKNRKGVLRNNTNLYTVFKEVNADLIAHEKADSTSFGTTDPADTSVGTIPPDNYAHVAAGVYINTSNFSFVPQTATDLQQFAQFIDNSNIFILGSRIQTLYQNGISRTSRSPALNGTVVTTIINGETVQTIDNTVGQAIVPFTQCTTYHLAMGSSSPVDSIDNGDDVVEFTPSVSALDGYAFDAKFNAVRIGDILTVNYGSLTTSSIIREVKYTASARRFLVRLDSKNLLASTTAVAQITRPLFNTEKFGVLAVAQAQPTTPISGALPSLIVGAPRGAEVLGNGFNPDVLDSTHYNLYLVIYPTGNPAEGSLALAPIDVTGNQGSTPGLYTLDSIVEATNAAFRKPGFNYRFIAYSYQGNFGVMLADSYGGVSFSVLGGIVGTNGAYDQNLSTTVYANNVVNLFDGKDGLGFGPNGSGVVSPPYSATFVNGLVSQIPTKIFVPLARKTFYVNGVERERLNFEPNQELDTNGDGYWPAVISSKQIIGSRVRATYQVNRDLSTSGIAIGKTIVVQSEGGSGTQVDFGRFFIENIQFNTCNCDGYDSFALITVYDAVHGTGVTPYVSAPIGTKTRLYFSGESVGFNKENLSDETEQTIYKRYFEVFVNQDGYTFTQERGRMNVSGMDKIVNGVTLYGSPALQDINIVKISPKLKGYSFLGVKKINLQITSYNQTSGIYSGYLCYYDGYATSLQGPVTTGKKGLVTRFFNNNVDYIDFVFDSGDAVPTISTTQYMDVQLFPSLTLDDEVMPLATVQVSDQSTSLSHLKDARQFGNVSENQLSTSALDFISAPTRLLSENGIIRGFDVTSIPTGVSPYSNNVSINGGVAIINGKIVQMNDQVIAVPVIQEALYPTFATTVSTVKMFLCVNEVGEYEFVANTDLSEAEATPYLTAGSDYDRLFYAKNPNNPSGAPYVVRGSYLQDIVKNQRDIVPVAQLTFTVSLVGLNYVISTCSSQDFRRYIVNGNGGFGNTFTLSTEGNFKNATTLINWLNQLVNNRSASIGFKSLGTSVNVKGQNLVTSAITFDFLSPVKFEGDGQIVFTGNGQFILGSNIGFQDIKFSATVAPAGGSLTNTVSLSNLYCPVQSTVKNVHVKNCEFRVPTSVHYPFIGFDATLPTNVIQNVNISNNRFFADGVDEDKLGSVVFQYNNVAASTSEEAPKLIDCVIEGNVFNKNQLIIISSIAASGVVNNAFATINCRISKNICGAICYINRYDTPREVLNSSFTDYVLNKPASLIINENSCRFIYNGYASGLRGFGTSASTQLIAFYTGNAEIKDNSCSWIHVGVRVPTLSTFVNPTLMISDNELVAFNSSFLDIYYTGTTTIQANTGIIVLESVG